MKSEHTYKLVISYDGTRYGGWQTQLNSDTIQARLEEPLCRIFSEKVSTHGSGRTDAGVHARGQVVSFHAGKLIQPATLVRALNANLPEGIRVRTAGLVDGRFHARFSAKSKEYRYYLVNAKVMDPFLRHHALHHPRPLDIMAMRRLATVFVGKHDFVALSTKPQREIDNTVRTITNLTVTKRGPIITIAVRGDGFLYRMVRSLVGALLKVGRGDVRVEEVERYFRAGKRTYFITTVPAHGLTLWKVWY